MYRCRPIRCIRLAPWTWWRGSSAAFPVASARIAAATLLTAGLDAACRFPSANVVEFLADAHPTGIPRLHKKGPSSWLASTRPHAHVIPSADAVPHSLGEFMHVAIHKKPRVACRPWRLQLPVRRQA